jgi:hypothetical protein
MELFQVMGISALGELLEERGCLVTSLAMFILMALVLHEGLVL